MHYATIRSWSFASETTSRVPIDFYIDFTERAKKNPSLEHAVRQAANRLNQILFPHFQFKVSLKTASIQKTRHIRVHDEGCNARLGAQQHHGNKYGYLSCFIGGGWRGYWKTHNVDSIIHELFHTLGRFHEHRQADSPILIQNFSKHQLSSENFLEFYDPFSLMHYSSSLINAVIGKSEIRPQTTVIKSLMDQGYPKKLALDYYDALRGLNENHCNWDAFNLGFGLLTRRDFTTLRKTACIIDETWCDFESPIPLFAFTSQPKISYHYLLKLTKIFVHSHYQNEKLIVGAAHKTVEIQSNQCYIIHLIHFFQVYPKTGIHCDVITPLLKQSIATFSPLNFLRKTNNSCILKIEKEGINPWASSSIQSHIIFYLNKANVSRTLQWKPLLTNRTAHDASAAQCISIPNHFFQTVFNKTTMPFLHSETVSGSYLNFYERNKYFFRLGFNAIPFFIFGFITGITRHAEWIIFFNDKETFSKTRRHLKHLAQWAISFMHVGLSSYALYQHIIEENARQLLIPFLNENRQLFQTADLMDRLNNHESCLTLLLPYGINTTILLLSAHVKPIHQHPMTQWGFTQSLSLLAACLINHANTYSHLELVIGISLYLGGTRLGYCLTANCLLFFKKLEPYVSLCCSHRGGPHQTEGTPSIQREQEIKPRCTKALKSTTSVITAMNQAWNTVTFSKFTKALSRTAWISFFTLKTEKNTPTKDADAEMHAMNPAENRP